MSHACRNEEMPGHFRDRVQHGKVPDSLFLQRFHEPAARPAKFLDVYWSCHQLSGALRIA
jgi:hypothetical protein